MSGLPVSFLFYNAACFLHHSVTLLYNCRVINTTYCTLDVQLHVIQNHLKSKLNEQQAALELLKKQHDRERVRCGFITILIVLHYLE